MVTGAQLARLTLAKAVANTALRWIPFFLFVLEDAFDTSIGRLTLILGVGEMAGLGTLLVGRRLDRGGERLLLLSSMVAVSVSGLVALGGNVAFFAVAFLLVIAGVSLVTVAGHTWLSTRVSFEGRGRVIGVFEMSWALALLVGAPSIALIINLFGWRGPFVLTTVLGIVAAVILAGLPDAPRLPDAHGSDGAGAPLGRRAWQLIVAAAAVAAAGLTTIVVVGSWLEDEFGISTGAVGLTAMAFGFTELIASASSARFSDRLGKARTTRVALAVLACGLGLMMAAGGSFAIAVVGLALFFLGFEYSIVTSFAIVSEGAPAARGRALATNNAVGTLARGSGTVAAGQLFEAFGIAGPATLSMVAAAIAFTLLWRS